MGEIMLRKDSLTTCSMGYAISVMDNEDNEICELVRNNCCVCKCCGDVEFDIHINGEVTGSVIAKEWGAQV